MAKGRKFTKAPERIEPKAEVKKPIISGWMREAVLLAGLMTPYRIAGRVGDIKPIPEDIFDELVRLKKIKPV